MPRLQTNKLACLVARVIITSIAKAKLPRARRYLRINTVEDTVWVDDGTRNPKMMHLLRLQWERLNDRELHGKTVLFNGDEFVATRMVSSNASEVVEKLIR